jgi:Na+/H+ antiporter NhaD/arsenite permease-like protein
MGEDVLIFATLTTGAVLIATHVGRLIHSSIQHRTIREALSRDSSAVPALLAGIEEQQPTGANDDRMAFVLMAIALALFLFGLIQGDPDDLRNMGGAALFPGLVGAALLIRHYFARRRENGN